MIFNTHWLLKIPPIDLEVFRVSYLKTLDTIGICQRQVFSLGVSQHMRNKTNLLMFELNRSSKLRDNNERQNNLFTRSCLLSDAWFGNLKFLIRSRIQIHGKLLFPRKVRYFRGSRFSQCFIHYQQLSIARYQVRFYANN